jgi:hypothetical protein
LNVGAAPAAKIALGKDADEVPVFRDHEMTDAPPPHPRPGQVRRFLGIDGDDALPHDFAKPHDAELYQDREMNSSGYGDPSRPGHRRSRKPSQEETGEGRSKKHGARSRIS